MFQLGIIGAGNMGSAIIEGTLAKKLFRKEEVIASAKSLNSVKLKSLQERTGILVTDQNSEVAKQSDIIVLGVKPYLYEDVIREIAPFVDESKLIVSIAPGKSLEWLEETFGKEVPLVRCMPNTPAMVGEGMTGYCCSAKVSAEQKRELEKLLSAIGKSYEVPETQMDAVVAVSGSSPAYIFVLMEAMADEAVALGMTREAAYTFVAQSVLGSAKLMQETGLHPGQLKDMVCSPGGTTIEAVRTLEMTGFRSAIQEAMEACADKAKRM